MSKAKKDEKPVPAQGKKSEKKPAETVNLSPEELRKISGGAGQLHSPLPKK